MLASCHCAAALALFRHHQHCRQSSNAEQHTCLRCSCPTCRQHRILCSCRAMLNLSAAGMTALQQLPLITKDLPANLSGLAALTSLSIGDLAPWQQTTAKQLEVGAGFGITFQSLTAQRCCDLLLRSCWQPSMLLMWEEGGPGFCFRPQFPFQALTGQSKGYGMAGCTGCCGLHAWPLPAAAASLQP